VLLRDWSLARTIWFKGQRWAGQLLSLGAKKGCCPRRLLVVTEKREK
jgi:hypothetical protein